MPAMLLLLVFALFSCNTATPMTSAASSSTPPIEITTDGGFAGRGLGGVSIDGSSITAKDLARSCHGELTAAERKTIEREAAAFTATKDAPPAHPDQVGYTLTVGEQSMSWHGEEAPAAAAPLFNAAWRARDRVLQGDCH